MLLGAAGEASTVIGNLGEEHAEGVTVYNLEVEDAHSYFVRGKERLMTLFLGTSYFVRGKERLMTLFLGTTVTIFASHPYAVYDAGRDIYIQVCRSGDQFTAPLTVWYYLSESRPGVLGAVPRGIAPDKWDFAGETHASIYDKAKCTATIGSGDSTATVSLHASASASALEAHTVAMAVGRSPTYFVAAPPPAGQDMRKASATVARSAWTVARNPTQRFATAQMAVPDATWEDLAAVTRLSLKEISSWASPCAGGALPAKAVMGQQFSVPNTIYLSVGASWAGPDDKSGGKNAGKKRDEMRWLERAGNGMEGAYELFDLVRRPDLVAETTTADQWIDAEGVKTAVGDNSGDVAEYQDGYNYKDAAARLEDAEAGYMAVLRAGTGYHIEVTDNPTDALYNADAAYLMYSGHGEWDSTAGDFKLYVNYKVSEYQVNNKYSLFFKKSIDIAGSPHHALAGIHIWACFSATAPWEKFAAAPADGLPNVYLYTALTRDWMPVTDMEIGRTGLL